MPEDRSDEQATTKEFPYPPIPSPERAKVEDIQQRLLRVAMLGYVPPDDLHVIADAAHAISASEKRAEEAEEHALTVIEVARNNCRQYERERDSLRSSLARVQPVYDAAIAWERCYLTVAGNPSELELRQAVRTALHRSQGE